MVKLQRKIKEISVKVKGGRPENRGRGCFWGLSSVLFLHPADGYMAGVGEGDDGVHKYSCY